MHVKILYEDNHLLVVNKPHGMPSQNDETGDLSVNTWVMEYLREKYQKPGGVYVGLVHRIDRPTGGILVLARTSKAAERLSKQFAESKVKKMYYAVTEHIPDPLAGSLTHYMDKLPGKNIMKAFPKPVPNSKLATLDYEVLHTKKGRALVAVWPKTGRQHQIRVQLAAIGCVLQGDVKYGRTDFTPDKCIALFAKQITFEHPTTKELLTIEADLPDTEVWVPWKG